MNPFISGLEDILVPFFVFAMIVLVVWLNNRMMQAKAQARAELNKHFLDKFTSGQDLSEFLGKEGSQRFLDEMWAEKRRSTEQRILSTIKTGVIVTAVGIAMLLITFFEDSDFLIPALIVSSVGVGLLVAAWVSYRFSKAWGLTKDDNDDGPAAVSPRMA